VLYDDFEGKFGCKVCGKLVEVNEGVKEINVKVGEMFPMRTSWLREVLR